MSSILRLRAGPDQLVVPVAVVALAAAGGGYFAPTWTAAGVALLGTVAIVVLLAKHVELGSLDVTVLTTLGALACWTALSVSWSLDPAASVLEAQRALLYLTALAALLLAVRRRSVTPLVAATAAACAVVSIHALAAWATDAALPVGYSEALGLVAVVGLILALGPALRRQMVAIAAIAPLAAVLALSGSRAAVAALAIGLAVALVLARGPRTPVVALVVVAAAFVLSGPGGDSLQARARVWGVALQSAAAEPLRGTGAGSFSRTWRQHRPVRRNVRDAHSLYVETLAELGAVGLALLLAVLAVPLAAAVRAREQPLVPAAAGAYVAYLVHAGAHWDWELPAVTLLALACAAAPIAAARRPADPRSVGSRARATALAAVLAAGAFAAVGTVGSMALERGRAAAALGALTEARSAAHEAARLAPWSGEPWRLLGETALSRGDRAGARASFARGLRRDPQSWRLWAGLAQASDGANRRAAAQRAAALNPGG
jgi:O-antigen ligase